MKFKFLFSVLTVFLFVTLTARAQDDNFRVEISLRENSITALRKNNPVTVKITNFSEENLKTEIFRKIYLYLSTCAEERQCRGREDVFIAAAPIPSKTLKKNESLSFEINPAQLHWHDSVSSQFDARQPKNFSIVPVTNNYLHASVKFIEGFTQIGSTKVPLVKEFESNKIVLMLKAPPKN